MNRDAEDVLRIFQCDYNRNIEELFAQTLSENEKVRVFFINEDEAFTDGQNIVVDPAIGNVFADRDALRRTEDFMHLEHQISSDLWYALRMITRGQTIHECLHVLYTNFPPDACKDVRANTKIRQKTLAMIANIIEDAFIEAVGCSVYDNLEFFLSFQRLAVLFSSKPVAGTAEKTFSKETDADQGADREDTGISLLTEYLDYMALLLLYPMVVLDEPSAEIAEYITQTRQLFLDGSVCGDPDERFTYSQRIFDIIEPLIPEGVEETDRCQSEMEELKHLLPGVKTHSGESAAISTVVRKGKGTVVTRRLFTDSDGNMLFEGDFGEQPVLVLDEYDIDREAALKIVLQKPVYVTWTGEQFDCHGIHRDIRLIEKKPKPNLNLRRAYQNIYDKYKININSYNSRFTQLLSARVTVREEKKLFGAGISSRRLADTEKKYWYSNGEEFGIPDLAVLLLIDGSGSMFGARRESAMISSVVLHEVLQKQEISHAIVEHRAIYGKPEVQHNILFDFHGKNEEKFNILALSADEGTREGLSLFWAERYIGSQPEAEKLIIVLSDGLPAHNAGNGSVYVPPVSVRDTANAVRKIMKRGTDIIAVALDDGDDGGCYDNLTEIYPTVIACSDLKRLTGQLLGIISKRLQ